jgi:hypothetical protein
VLSMFHCQSHCCHHRANHCNSVVRLDSPVRFHIGLGRLLP